MPFKDERARQFFTDRGFDQYIVALDKSRNLETVKQENLVSSGEIAGEISMRNTFIGGRYVWYVDIPMRIRYRQPSIPVKMFLM